MDPCIFPSGDKAPHRDFSDPMHILHAERWFSVFAEYCLHVGASSVSSAGHSISPQEASGWSPMWQDHAIHSCTFFTVNEMPQLNVVWDFMPVDQALRKPWIVQLAERGPEGMKGNANLTQNRCLFFWEWTMSPSRMEGAQPSQLATKLPGVSPQEIVHTRASELAYTLVVNCSLLLAVWTWGSSIRGISFATWLSMLSGPCIAMVATSFLCPLCCLQRRPQHSCLWRWAGIPPVPCPSPVGRIMEGEDHVHSSSFGNRLWYSTQSTLAKTYT